MRRCDFRLIFRRFCGFASTLNLAFVIAFLERDIILAVAFDNPSEGYAMGKEAKTDAELEDMILQRLVIGGVFVSVRPDPVLGWRPTVVTAPKHTKNAQELADKIATELRKKFTLKD
jgi:hypothetical protein